MKRYRLLNNISGWSIFLIAATVYMKTMEPTASFWDCGEFIASAFRLQVGHQPGAPLFIMIGKVFSLIASEPKQVAFWVNLSSALVSAATILFLFWTITALAFKLVVTDKEEIAPGKLMSILGAGFVGALAFTFSDTFWFSAVEAEVYALSALCTAIVFWGALKWDAAADQPLANRWLVFIAYILGLSIGLHLLNLLTIPAMVLLYYFRRNKEISFKGTILAVLVGCFILACIQYGIIQYLVYFASRFDLLFVNTFGLGFGSGVLFFVLLVVSAITYGIFYSIRAKKVNLNLALICVTFILMGYASYAMIVIRSNAKTAINLSSPDNPMSLLGYLGRDQYGDRPLLYGQYFDSEAVSDEAGSVLYRKGKTNYEVAETTTNRTYDRNAVFPRVYSNKPAHQAYYRSWLGLGEGEKPSFKDNFSFFASYQVGFMYMRYFMWNFAGKQDDEQGSGGIVNGNWLTGIKKLDEVRLGNQERLSIGATSNEGRNRFYALPLILGLLGLIYQFRKNSRDMTVISLLFLSTGIGIVIYLNQDPLQVRERDYAYVGSFYAFAIWIGLGMLAVKDLVSRISKEKVAAGLSFALCVAAVPYLMGKEGWDDHDRSNRYTAHDMAVNYLESCAPNAILFTNADNDTYPLWYAQHVENVRPDVRIVCLQLVYNDSYIDQMKTQLFDSAPLPVSMPHEKYVRGVRDYLPYVDYGFTDSVELKDVFDVMTSDDQNDKVEMRDGSYFNFLPTKKFRLSVNADQVIKTGTLPASYRNQIADKMEWTYDKDYVTRTDLAIIDILVHNDWKRPVYFADRISEDSYIGLDRYLHLEGFAYRLLPLKRDAADKRDKSDVANTPVLYNNLMNKFTVSSFNKVKYLDPESRRVAGMTWSAFNTLASNLIQSGETEKAGKVMNRAMANLPIRNYSLIDTANKFAACQNLFALKQTTRAAKLADSATSFITSELNYYASLAYEDQAACADQLKYALFLISKYRELAEVTNRKAAVAEIDKLFQSLSGRLISLES